MYVIVVSRLIVTYIEMTYYGFKSHNRASFSEFSYAFPRCSPSNSTSLVITTSIGYSRPPRVTDAPPFEARKVTGSEPAIPRLTRMTMRLKEIP